MSRTSLTNPLSKARSDDVLNMFEDAASRQKSANALKSRVSSKVGSFIASVICCAI